MMKGGILRYTGGKFRVARDLYALAPDQWGEMRDPFCGGNNFLWHLPPGKQVWINDINPDVVKFWKSLRDDPSFIDDALALKEKCETADNLEREFAWAKWRWQRTGHPVSYLLLNRHAYAQFVKRSRPNIASLSLMHISNGMACVTRKKFEQARDRLRGAKITCGDYWTILDDYNRDAFYLIDPPYLIGNAKHRGSALYDFEFTDEMMIQLYERLRDTRNRFLMTMGWGELTHQLFVLSGEFITTARKYSYTNVIRTLGREDRVTGEALELVVRNYEI